jgi:hypothetical protein
VKGVLNLRPAVACACLSTCRLWGKIFERAAAAKADFDAASITAFLWAATTAGAPMVCSMFVQQQHSRQNVLLCACGLFSCEIQEQAYGCFVNCYSALAV